MNKKFYVILAIAAAVLLYLFSKRGTTGFLAPTAGAQPIAGNQGVSVLGIPLSLLPHTGLTSPSAGSGAPSDPGAAFITPTQGPLAPPGYNPNDPSTWPSQEPLGVTVGGTDPLSLYSTDTLAV